jgi:hypothetical protein
MLAVVVLVVVIFRRDVPELFVARLDVVTPQTSDPFALSPDGQLVFAVAKISPRRGQNWEEVSGWQIAGLDVSKNPQTRWDARCSKIR